MATGEVFNFRKETEPLAVETMAFDSGGGGGDDDGMLKRITALETSMRQVQIDMAVVKSNYATKSDVAEAKNSIIMWVVSAILLAQVLPSLLRHFGLN